jgi:hypothetical protein
MLPTTKRLPRDIEPAYPITVDGELVNGYVFDMGGLHYAAWFVSGWAAPFVTDSESSNIQTDRVLSHDDYFRIFPNATAKPRFSVKELVKDVHVTRADNVRLVEHPEGPMLPSPAASYTVATRDQRMLESEHADEPN